MLIARYIVIYAAVLISSMLGGCAWVPEFDTPTTPLGQPTAASIVRRVEYEIREMVRDDKDPRDVSSFYRSFLLDNDYDFEISLSLDVNDTGGLTPSLSSITPFTAMTSAVWSATGTLSKSRDQNFTENMQFSVKKIYCDWKRNAIVDGDAQQPPPDDANPRFSALKAYCGWKSNKLVPGNAHNIPPDDTNLAGDLGLQNIVALASSSQGLDVSLALKDKGVFGGSIQFLVTENLSAAGPTWTLTHFKGPGPLASLSQINTDKLTIAFAPGAAKPPPTKANPNPINPLAYAFLQQLLLSTVVISSEIITLQNSLR
jgi:hypothetical protein